MRNYCNLYEWGIGISGRHPFGGKMGNDDVEAFANIALAGDLSGRGIRSIMLWQQIIYG